MLRSVTPAGFSKRFLVAFQTLGVSSFSHYIVYGFLKAIFWSATLQPNTYPCFLAAGTVLLLSFIFLALRKEVLKRHTANNNHSGRFHNTWPLLPPMSRFISLLLNKQW